MAKTQTIGKTATSIFTENGFTYVVYHSTPVVKYNHEKIILNSGGWYTNTTKTRMNQTSNQFGLGFRVWQVNFGWKVDFNGQTVDFVDGMELTRP